MRLKLLLTSITFCLFSQLSVAQGTFKFFTEKADIPKDLLKTRSVVFMNVNSLDWEKEAAKIHKSFREVGIDAVAYYALSDILSGHDATNAFYRDITERSISSMIIINKESDEYAAYMADIPEGGSFFVPDMEVYDLRAADLEALGAKIVMTAEQADLERGNFLIIDVPEIFQRTNVIKTRRVADFNPDLRIDKLAVPKFENSVLLDGDVDAMNAELDSLLKDNYPFRYGLVDPNITDEELISNGYLMVLRKLENNVESLKRMLGYELKENETIHISTRKGQPDTITKIFANQNAHKYYVQQLYTKDIYLGNIWDAGISWQEALLNHITNLKADMRR